MRDFDKQIADGSAKQIAILWHREAVCFTMSKVHN